MALILAQALGSADTKDKPHSIPTC